jgi:hypothetical protein
MWVKKKGVEDVAFDTRNYISTEQQKKIGGKCKTNVESLATSTEFKGV